MPQLSIIIPTHKRSKILARCIEHIEQQTIADDLEVIVVSDGHDDKTSALFKKSTWQVPVKFLEISKSQQGTARNRGVKDATSPLCLFIGDDALLEPNACEAHVQAHKQQQAVLGFTTWDPSADITPVMRWLEQSGWQFAYPKIAEYAHTTIPQSIQHRFAYTINISLPTALARKFPFREDITMYGWEDIEWGMRLRNAGVRLFYEPRARALHNHHVDFETSLKRMETLGKSAVHIKKLAPEFDRLPTGWKLLGYRIAALLPTMTGKHRKAFLKGIYQVESARPDNSVGWGK